MADMPAKIWATDANADYMRHPSWGPHAYVRADLVEQMAAALRDAIRVADEAREEWDKAPSGMKAGKLLIALSDPSLKYRADITAIHAALQAYEAAQPANQAEAR
jgi:hypothetical protein